MEEVKPGLFIKQGYFGCRIVYPIKRNDGTINWFNLLTGGSYWNLIKIILLIILILVVTLAYRRDVLVVVNALNKATANPCEWCRYVTARTENFSVPKLNLTDWLKQNISIA